MTLGELLSKHTFAYQYNISVCREIGPEEYLPGHKFGDKKIIQLDYADSEESPVEEYLTQYFKYEVVEFGINNGTFDIELVVIIRW